jgi:DNA adenine methylase
MARWAGWIRRDGRPPWELVAQGDIRSQDGPGTLFYCDPPCLHETRSAKKVYGDFEKSEADHRELLDALLAVKRKVMLSG